MLEGNFKEKEKCIIKIGNFEDIQIENEFLKKLKDENFVPKLFLEGKTYSIREKLEGKNIKDFLENSTKKKTIIVLNKIFKITKKMDELKINKQEMTNPYKHIFIDSKLNVKMIDYERCLFTNKPKNTTQFFQYIKRNIKLLESKNIFLDSNKIFEISKKFKKEIFKISLDMFEK